VDEAKPPSRSTIKSRSPVLPEARISSRAIPGGRFPHGGGRGTPEAERANGGSARSTWRSFSAVMGVPYGKRGQACHRRFVPGREVERARELADLRLAEPRVDQRRADATLPGRGHAGAVVAQIARRRAVDEVPEALGPGERLKSREQLLLAEEAPVRRVRGVVRVLQLSRLDDHVPEAHPGGESPRLLEFALGVTLRVGGHQDGRVPRASRAPSRGASSPPRPRTRRPRSPLAQSGERRRTPRVSGGPGQGRDGAGPSELNLHHLPNNDSAVDVVAVRRSAGSARSPRPWRRSRCRTRWRGGGRLVRPLPRPDPMNPLRMCPARSGRTDSSGYGHEEEVGGDHQRAVLALLDHHDPRAPPEDRARGPTRLGPLPACASVSLTRARPPRPAPSGAPGFP
jgi:hypothetical protein